MIEHYKDLLRQSFPKELTLETIEIPPQPEMGDLAVPCFQFAKQLKKSPQAIAEELAGQVTLPPEIERVEIAGPYLNFFLSRQSIGEEVLQQIDEKKEFFAASDEGKDRTVVIDYSAPNIAKPFGIGHLRSTVLGRALVRLHEYFGYTTVGVNHLGDWGTQYGKLVVAWRMWGDKEKLDEDPIGHLYSLYVKFHEEEEIDPDLTEQGRDAFAKLEKGDEEAVRMWELFREASLEEFQKHYEYLDVSFDSYEGEAFYNDRMGDVIEQVHETGKVEKSDGALVVPMGEEKPPLILVKSNGTSTYATRDLAAAVYRAETYKPEKVLYVVGMPQRLHFEQVFTVLEHMGYSKEMFVHVDFGLIRFEEGKMSTRKGKIIFLEDVLDIAVKKAREIIEEKNPELEDKETVAKQIGLGAVVFGDLSNDRNRDIIFDWDRVVSFEGETAPYLQYTHARLSSILRRMGDVDGSISMTDDKEFMVVKRLLFFEEAVRDSLRQYKPSILAHYLIELAKETNEFYQHCPVMQAEGDVRFTRARIVDAARLTLRQGLFLLGIEAPEAM